MMQVRSWKKRMMRIVIVRRTDAELTKNMITSRAIAGKTEKGPVAAERTKGVKIKAGLAL
jgi:hypothetical protein